MMYCSVVRRRRGQKDDETAKAVEFCEKLRVLQKPSSFANRRILQEPPSSAKHRVLQEPSSSARTVEFYETSSSA